MTRPVVSACVVVGRDDLLSYQGAIDDRGRSHGEGKATYCSGDVYEGGFRNGHESGQGQWRFVDGTVLTSTFEDGTAHGKGCYVDPEEGVRRHGTFIRGDLEGFGWESDDDGDVTLRSFFHAGRQTGYCESFDDAGCATAGTLDQEGSFTGKNISFVFPDGVTCITGEFLDGEFMCGRYGRLLTPLAPRHERVIGSIENHPACFVHIADDAMQVSAPVAGTLAAELLVRDEYECERVEVRESRCNSDCAGEGLFARRPLKKGEIFSFYNGVRITHSVVDGREWSLNERTASLDSDTVLDVPPEFATRERYCASLGHFANHSRWPNAHYTSGFEHPRFGEIVCLRANRAIEVGEEILCDYAYKHEVVTTTGEVVQDLPAWFAKSGRCPNDPSEPMTKRSRCATPLD